LAALTRVTTTEESSMSTRKIRRYVERGTRTFRYRNWLPPDSGWPELDQLHVEHVRLLDAVAAAGSAVDAIRNRHKAEDEARVEALRDAVRANSDPTDVPVGTSPEDRQAELAAAVEQRNAVLDALDEFLGETLTTLAERREEWVVDIRRQASEAEAKRAEARRLVAEADNIVAEVQKMAIWLARSTGTFRALPPYPWGELVAPPAPDFGQPIEVLNSPEELEELSHA
jgi:hypothetical protein